MLQYADKLTHIFDATSAAASFDSILTIENGVNTGTILVTTSAAFDGTTATMTLQGSLDGVNYTTVYQDDNVTAMSLTLTSNNTDAWELKRVFFRFYKLVYTVGNATAGTITALAQQRHSYAL